MDADLERARAQLREWIARHTPVAPVPPFEPSPCPVGTAADLPMLPGPQPHNGGITPGYRPARPADDPATVADLKALAAGVRAVLGELEARIDAAEDAVVDLETNRVCGEPRREATTGRG